MMLLLAEAVDTIIAAFFGGLAGLAAALGAIYSIYLKFKTTQGEREAKQEVVKQQVEQDAFARAETAYKGYIESLKEERDRDKATIILHTNQMQDAQKAIDLLKQSYQECEMDKEILWAMAERQHDQAIDIYECSCRMNEALRKLGAEPGPLPKRPGDVTPRRQRSSGVHEAADIAARTAQQGATIIKEISGDSTRGAP